MKLLKWTEKAQDRHEWKKIVEKVKNTRVVALIKKKKKKKKKQVKVEHKPAAIMTLF
jgi:hypothetical protein